MLERFEAIASRALGVVAAAALLVMMLLTFVDVIGRYGFHHSIFGAAEIIEHLMMRAGQVISKSDLTDRLYDQDFERDSNVIEVFIGRLRKKIDPDNTLKPIETLRGRGYRFALERNQRE